MLRAGCAATRTEPHQPKGQHVIRSATGHSVGVGRKVRVGLAFRRMFWIAALTVLSLVAFGSAAEAASPIPTASTSLDAFSRDASGGLAQLSVDPFTDPASQHRTQVEPASFSNGQRVVTAFQSGRFFDAGASDIGWAASASGGADGWRHGFLPGMTTAAGGPYARVSDPSVAYDAAHRVWLITALALDAAPHGVAILVSRSRSGLDWSAPVTVASANTATGEDFDKPWTVCDNTPSSPFFGHCYAEFDDFGHADRVKMSTSTDGGQTWGPPLDAAAGSLGFGGQPVVQPNGTVIVPTADLVFRSIFAFRSTDGGASWSAGTTVSPVTYHAAAGPLRSGPLPSVAIDPTGRVYVAWQDCRFRAACTSNDIVLSTSDDGINWSPVSRVPIDAAGSGADHFIPGLAVAPEGSGRQARLALTYYYYPAADCTTDTCQLDVGLIQSPDGGINWADPSQLAGPMSLSWLPNTSQGVMVGDYISTSFLDGVSQPFFALAKPPSQALFNQAIYTTAGARDELGHRLWSAQPATSAPLVQREGTPGTRGSGR